MILTLQEAAERLGIEGDYRAVLQRLRSMERFSGRTLVVASGTGTGRRYVVLQNELEAVMAGGVEPVEPEAAHAEDIEVIAAKVAAEVQRLHDRMTTLSERLFSIERRLGM